MSASPRPGPTLFYCVSPANHGLVFATPERATEIDRLHCAILDSRTWGEFRNAMPTGEYEQIVSVVFDEAGEDRPEADEPFNSSAVPGYCDGDYPPWLALEMEHVLPPAVLERFGRWVETSINGWYVHFDPALETDVVAMLTEAGYEVVERGDLMFW